MVPFAIFVVFFQPHAIIALVSYGRGSMGKGDSRKSVLDRFAARKGKVSFVLAYVAFSAYEWMR